MKLNLLLVIICAYFLAACGKQSVDPKELFPKSVGKSTLEKVAFADKENWNEWGYKSSKYTGKRYQLLTSSYKGDDGYSFQYNVSQHENTTMAKDEFAEISVCKELFAGAKDWKEMPLKDKAGKEIGQMKICRTDADFEGNSTYYYVLRKDNLISLITDNPSAKGGDRTVDFIKALPLNANLDLSVLDEITAEIAKNKGVSKESLSNLSPPEQIAEKPYLKGKVYEISTEENKFISDDLKAKNTSEIGSILKVSCGKGSQIGNYNANGQMVPAYTSNCKVTVIDYTIPAVIAKQFFANATIPSSMTFGTKDGKIESGKEVVAPIPFDDIKKWVDSLPKN